MCVCVCLCVHMPVCVYVCVGVCVCPPLKSVFTYIAFEHIDLLFGEYEPTDAHSRPELQKTNSTCQQFPVQDLFHRRLGCVFLRLYGFIPGVSKHLT